MQEPPKAWVDSRDKRKGDASEAVAHRLVYWQMGDPEPPTPCKSPGAAQTPGSRACHSTADYNNQVSKVRRVLTYRSRYVACRHCHRHSSLPVSKPCKSPGAMHMLCSPHAAAQQRDHLWRRAVHDLSWLMHALHRSACICLNA